MIKALLIDADGVTLVKNGYFSDVFAREYQVPVEKIIPFFKNEFRRCQLGIADVREVLPPYLEDWGWKGSVDEFLQYWFQSSTVVDERVIAKIQEIRAMGIRCYLATDQEKYRAKFLREHLQFDRLFDGCFFSCDVGVSKSDVAFFKTIETELHLSGEEIKYLDDEEGNVKAAKESGIQAELYRGLQDLKL